MPKAAGSEPFRKYVPTHKSAAFTANISLLLSFAGGVFRQRPRYFACGIISSSTRCDYRVSNWSEWSGIQIATKNIASISQSVNRSVGRKATLETTLYDFVTARSDNRRQRHPGVYHKHTPDTRLSTLRYQYRTSQRLLRLRETPWNMSCLLYKAVTGRRVATVWMTLAGEQDASSIIGHTSMHLVTATGRQSWVEHGWRTFGPVRRDETTTAWRWRGWRCRLWRVVVRRPSSSSSSSLFVSDDSSSNSPRRSDTTSPTLWLLHWCVEHNATK